LGKRKLNIIEDKKKKESELMFAPNWGDGDFCKWCETF